MFLSDQVDVRSRFLQFLAFDSTESSTEQFFCRALKPERFEKTSQAVTAALHWSSVRFAEVFNSLTSGLRYDDGFVQVCVGETREGSSQHAVTEKWILDSIQFHVVMPFTDYPVTP